MKLFFQTRFALTEEGVKGMIRSILIVTLNNLSNILLFMLVFFFLKDALALSKGEEISLYKYSAGLFVLGLRILLERLQYDSTFTTAYTETEKKRMALAKRLAKLPISFFSGRDVPDLSRTLLKDVEALEHAYSHAVPQFFGAVISSTIIFLMISVLNFNVGLAIFWPIPFLAMLTLAMKKQKGRAEGKNHADSVAVSNKMQEILDNIMPIKTYQRQERSFQEFIALVRQSEKSLLRAEYYNPGILTMQQSLLKLGTVTAIWAIFHEFLEHKFDAIIALQLIISSVLIYAPLEAAMSFILEFMHIQTPIDRTNEILGLQTMIGEKKTPKNLDYVLRHVDFSYETETPVLKDVSTTIRQGEVTALVGPSGCGKSTLAKLLLRFYDPDGGKILLGEEDVAKWDPEDLLKNCSVVFQDVVLFNNTIRENIRIGKKGATDEEVMVAAKLAQAHDFIEALPKGYETVVGEGGRFLSGGERQRISNARALLKDAPIIFLDESTASVDADSETKIQQALSKLIKDKTVIVIAHRLRTVMNADKIIVLKEGCIVEEGKAEELLQKDGLFKQLYELQKGETA